jgi:hypothetical protein
MWQEMPTTGVLTHPRAHGAGAWLMPSSPRQRAKASTGRPVVQYRARRANTASLAVAARTGFIHYCDGVVIHLSP